MQFSDDLPHGSHENKSDLNHSLRLRFETLSKLASEIGEKSDYIGVQKALSINMKYLMEVYGFALLYEKGDEVYGILSFPREAEVILDPDHPIVGLGKAARKIGHPDLFKREEIDSNPAFENTSFKKPRVQAVMSYPLEVDADSFVTLLVANKAHDKYFPVDYRFCRFVLRITANKLEQIYSEATLKRTLSEKQELNDRLSHQQRFSEKILDSIGDGLLVTDFHGMIKQVNPAVLALTGWKTKDLVKKDAFSVLSLLSRYGEENELPTLVRAQSGGLKNVSGLILCANGDQIPVRFSCSRLSLDVMGDKGMVISLNDVRAQVAAEAQRKEMELARAVAEAERKRVAELTRLNEELDRFVYIASHDLRAPLTSILGLISILESTEDPEAQQSYLGLMNRSVKRLDTFIRNIVDYSRNSRVEVLREEVDLKKEVSEIIDGLGYLKGVEKIDFQLLLDSPRTILSDQTRIRIILNNFISNAVKYHDFSKAAPFIAISSGQDEGAIHLTIQDNGTGISKEHHKKLFEMFFRATAKGDGSGIGLYIVSEMIKKLEGKIDFSSELGVGSTFVIHLPLESKSRI